ncbi:hypothetical protein [Streptomyces rimosus]|uniref:hypothetical protein n=1 Tax=Streptomyces rimosus TaxID=1927 RepID=UPI003793224F
MAVHIGDVERLVKQWVALDRAGAKERGERPVYYSGLSNTKRTELFREAYFWHALASGELLEQCVQPRPTGANIEAMRMHLADCCERLHAMLNARGDTLPEGAREQLAAAEQRIGVALDIVEHAPAAWSREADAAWAELMRWAHRLETDSDRRSGEWVPDGWGAFTG